MRRFSTTHHYMVIAIFLGVVTVATTVPSQETPQEQLRREQSKRASIMTLKGESEEKEHSKRETLLLLIGESADIDVGDVTDRFDPENDFVMYHFGEQTYMLNRRSGMSWVLNADSLRKTLVWLPIDRIDDPMNANAWKKLEALQKNPSIQE